MPPAIRPAKLDDLQALLALEQQAASAAHWPTEEYEKLVKNGVVLVAEHANKVRGLVCARAVAGEWEIENIVVDAGFLRQGIADQLISALVERAEKGATSRILLEVRESNRPARRLYEKHQFHEVGRRRNYYNDPLEDAILYARCCESEK
jgi:ribosomal-protein-alanine N-acetyltransferase